MCLWESLRKKSLISNINWYQMKKDTFRAAAGYFNINLFQNQLSDLKRSFWCKLSQEYDWVAMTFIFCPSVKCFGIRYRFPIGIWPMMIEEGGSAPSLFRLKADSCPNYFSDIFFFLFNRKVYKNW